MFNFVLKCIYSHPVISLGPRAIIFDHHQQNYVCTNKSFAAQHATAIYDRLRSFLGCFNFLQCRQTLSQKNPFDWQNKYVLLGIPECFEALERKDKTRMHW